MTPVIGSALIAGAAEALGALANTLSGKKDRKLGRKKLKEEKRRTSAELYNASLERKNKLESHNREERNLMHARQAQALSELASGFRQSFLGG